MMGSFQCQHERAALLIAHACLRRELSLAGEGGTPVSLHGGPSGDVADTFCSEVAQKLTLPQLFFSPLI